MARANQEINASSMADIAFLLLIFYLVTTTMNVDAGISRILPPYVDKEIDDKGAEVKERNVLQVRINHLNDISVGGERVDISQVKEMAKNFILNPMDLPNLPEKEEADIPLIGKIGVTQAVVSLQNDKGTLYDQYIQVQNELTKAYNEAHNELAIKVFGRSLNELTEDEAKAIRKAIPNKISEAEPRDLSNKRK